MDSCAADRVYHSGEYMNPKIIQQSPGTGKKSKRGSAARSSRTLAIAKAFRQKTALSKRMSVGPASFIGASQLTEHAKKREAQVEVVGQPCKLKNADLKDAKSSKQFYHPVQLYDRENMVLFSEDETLSHKSMFDMFEDKKVDKKIEGYRDMIATLEKNKKHKELLKKQMVEKDNEQRADVLAAKKEEAKQVNLNRLPNLNVVIVGANVAKACTVYNPVQAAKAAKEAKKAKKMKVEGLEERGDTFSDATALTGAQTLQTISQGQQGTAAQPQNKHSAATQLDASMKLMEHDTKIVDYLKFDSTLCRE